ncbi:MAG: polysaccharide pyruvyl transferase family protein [Ruminococcaceae bacterium]|nr:polysaccharide pyruvyl transferase family protein [Oscillospiraceae bacterium]
MKVGIFTFPNSASYGATLQMYALCYAVGALGHEVEAINYYSSFMKKENHCRAGQSSAFAHAMKRTARRILHASLYARSSAFEKKNIPLYPRNFFSGRNMLPTVGLRYDAVICGSDQVWNPNITGGDLSYFLDFCSDSTRRISYAPSFGLDTLPEDFVAGAKRELTKFSSLSVREAQGQAIIADMIGREVPIVLDPTLLLEASQWQALEDTGFSVGEEFVLYYTVKSSPRLFAKCRSFAQQQGLKMIVVGGQWANRNQSKDSVVRYAVDISPATWLWLIHHARYVVTNSFHGTAFSVIFEKDFYLELSSLTNSRLNNIVSALALRDRVVPLEENITPVPANFSIMSERLAALRKASLNYLKDALSEDAIHG